MVVVCYLLLFFVFLLFFICRTSRRKHVSQKFTPPPVNSKSSTLPLDSNPQYSKSPKKSEASPPRSRRRHSFDAIPSTPFLHKEGRGLNFKKSQKREREGRARREVLFVLSLGCRKNFERGCLAISRTKNSCPSRRGRGPLTSTGVLLPELKYWMEPVWLMVGSVPLLEHPP